MSTYTVEVDSIVPVISTRPTYQTVEIIDALNRVALFNVESTIEITNINQNIIVVASTPVLGSDAVTRTITVTNPRSTEHITISYLSAPIVFGKIVAVITGTTPSIRWTIKYGPTLLSGTEVLVGGTTTTASTMLTTFDNPTVPANSFIWLETSNLVGTVAEFSVTLIYN